MTIRWMENNMKYEWKDLPKPLSCFTVRNATMVNLNTRKIIQHYSANTKIVVVQKCITPNCTYYRTREATHHHLNYAFEASAFGLPNEKASSEHSPISLRDKNASPNSHTPKRAMKQKPTRKRVSPKDEEGKRLSKLIKKFLRRKNG